MTAEFTDGTGNAKFAILASAGVSLLQTGDSCNVLYALTGLPVLTGIGLILKKRS